MQIPHGDLEKATLDRVIEEFVTRDGTDLGDADDKARSVRTGLERGELLLVYDADTESCNIVPADWPID